MKSLTQVVLPISCILLLIFGLSYMTSFTSNPRDLQQKAGPSSKANTGPKVETIYFPSAEAAYKPDDPYLKHFRHYYELNKPGFHDFWFRYTGETSLDLALRPSCSTCSGARLGLVPADALEKWKNAWPYSPALLPCQAFQAVPNPVLPILFYDMVMKSLTWKDFDITNESNTIPLPAASKAKPQLGLVRFFWTTKRADNPIHLHGDLIWASAKDPNLRLSVRLRVSLGVVAALSILPARVDVGELNFGEKATREFQVFSVTRSFTLDPSMIKDPLQDSCLSIDAIVPMTDAEKETLAVQIRPKDSPPPEIRSGYKVRVTLHERKGDKQLDLGKQDRTLEVWLADGEKAGFTISALVRGDVQVVEGSEVRDVIDFGPRYRSNLEKVKKVRLVAKRPDLDLELLPEERYPSFLQPELSEPMLVQGKKQWTLTVTIPKDTLYQELPLNSAIVVRTKETPPRRFKIPVKAIAAP